MKRVDSTRVHNNKLGYRGVEWENATKKFRARIEPANGQRGRWLGRHNTVQEAAQAYDDAARDVYGENAYLNFPGPGEKQCVATRRSEMLCPKGHNLNAHGYNHATGIECRECNKIAQRRYRSKEHTGSPGNERS